MPTEERGNIHDGNVPEEDRTITETISIPKDGGTDDVAKALRQIARVATALAGRVMLSTVTGDGKDMPVGAANPVVQNVYNCAVAAGTAFAVLTEHQRQRTNLVVPGMRPPGPLGRA